MTGWKPLSSLKQRECRRKIGRGIGQIYFTELEIPGAHPSRAGR